MASANIVNALVAWAGTHAARILQLTDERDAAVAAILSGGKPTISLHQRLGKWQELHRPGDARLDDKLATLTTVPVELGEIERSHLERRHLRELQRDPAMSTSAPIASPVTTPPIPTASDRSSLSRELAHGIPCASRRRTASSPPPNSSTPPATSSFSSLPNENPAKQSCRLGAPLAANLPAL